MSDESRDTEATADVPLRWASCPIGLNVDKLRADVALAYESIARSPEADHSFNHGADYAVELLRYDRAELETLPRECTDAFAGVANPHRIGPIHAGETVLDIGCGGGTDLLLSARKVGPGGRAIGVDMTAAMRDVARRAAETLGFAERVDIRDGVAEKLPVDDASVDVVQSNGVLNLVPDKIQAFREIARVLKPGGRLHLGDTTVATALKDDERANIDLWAA